MNKLAKIIALRLGLVVGLVVSLSASAHHSFSANFKINDKITVTGTVTKLSFRNPHVLLYFNVTNDDGTSTRWVSEAGSATNMRRKGWSRDSFKAGDLVRVTGDRSHDGSPMTSIDTVQILDASGGVIEELDDLRPAPPGSPGSAPPPKPQEAIVKAAPMPLTLDDGRPNLTGTWTRWGIAVGPPGRPTVTLTELGQAAQDTLFTKANDPQVFCDAPGLVRLAGMTPHPVRITQFDDHVQLDFEEYGESREVYFDERKALGYKSRLGDSVARYEGGSLIIESKNLLFNVTNPEGQPLSDKATATEIYTREDSEKFGPVVRIKMIIKDPDWLASDMVFDQLKMSAGDYEFVEAQCQPPLRKRTSVHPSTSFFLTSVGLGNGADLGGLEGADAHCESLAQTMNIGGKKWRAYLSTTGENSVNALDRIGQGPWYNSRGEVVAADLKHLHSTMNNIGKHTALTERGDTVSGRGDPINRHDILTGSRLDGTASSDESDTTCSNWASSGEGSALVGHFDRVGGGANPTSWNQAHGSRGCSQSNLQATGGDGLFYCFASIEDTASVAGLVSVSENSRQKTDLAEKNVRSKSEDGKTGVSIVAIVGLVLLLLFAGVFLLRRK